MGTCTRSRGGSSGTKRGSAAAHSLSISFASLCLANSLSGLFSMLAAVLLCMCLSLVWWHALVQARWSCVLVLPRASTTPPPCAPQAQLFSKASPPLPPSLPPFPSRQSMLDFTDSPQFIPHTQKLLTYSPHDVKWVPSSARLVSMGATPSGKGVLEVYALSGGELKKTAQAGK